MLHHALQVLSAAATTHLEHDADFQYSNVGYDLEEDGFKGRLMGEGVQMGMGGSPPHWRLYRDGAARGRLRVAGQTISTGVTWSRVALQKAGLPDKDLELPTWDLPPGPLQAGTVFPSVPDDAYLRLQAWFANSTRVLQAVQLAHDGGEVRVWPHHFDVATLISLGDGKSIGVGMSPGSPGIDEPYLYVSPWPYPKGDFPELTHGRWHTDGFTAALLSGDDLPDEGQDAVVATFLQQAIAGCRSLLS